MGFRGEVRGWLSATWDAPRVTPPAMRIQQSGTAGKTDGTRSRKGWMLPGKPPQIYMVLVFPAEGAKK
jgi:hypothetical protein